MHCYFLRVIAFFKLLCFVAAQVTSELKVSGSNLLSLGHFNDDLLLGGVPGLLSGLLAQEGHVGLVQVALGSVLGVRHLGLMRSSCNWKIKVSLKI